MSMESGFGRQLENFREARRELEESILPLATSVDGRRFSFVPPSLIERAVTFRQGEALIAGRISPQPALLRFGARVTEEGGADVPATWAAAR